MAVAEVEDVAVLDELCRRGGEDLVLALVVSAGRRSAEHLGRGVGLDQDCLAVRHFQVWRLARVRRPLACSKQSPSSCDHF